MNCFIRDLTLLKTNKVKLNTFFFVQISMSLLVAIAFFLVYKNDYDKKLNDIIVHETNALLHQEKSIALIFNNIVSDLLFLSNNLHV